jgi:peptidoglycan hydrolase FlgJ
MTALSPGALAGSPDAAQPNGAARDPKKVHDAAQQFESLLIGEMLRSAREESSEGWLGSGEGTGDDSAMDMAETQFANALSRSGGLGLAAMIERSLAPQAGVSPNDSQSTAQTLGAVTSSSSSKP